MIGGLGGERGLTLAACRARELCPSAPEGGSKSKSWCQNCPRAPSWQHLAWDFAGRETSREAGNSRDAKESRDMSAVLK